VITGDPKKIGKDVFHVLGSF